MFFHVFDLLLLYFIGKPFIKELHKVVIDKEEGGCLRFTTALIVVAIIAYLIADGLWVFTHLFAPIS